MNFLLDTNVVSEWVKPLPNQTVVKWLAEVNEDRVFISVITLVELRYGIERMTHSARRQRLDSWVTDELMPRFADRLLAVDINIADIWGRTMAQIESKGHSVKVMDACIAAIAKHHGLTLITRNVTDFESLGIKLINPWNSA